MNVLKRFIVLVPVLFVTWLLIESRYSWEYKSMGGTGILEITLNLLPLYAFILFDVKKRKPDSMVRMLVQSSFYVYILSVLFLTVYFVPFRDLVFSNHYYMKKLAH